MYYVYVQGEADAIVCTTGEEAFAVGKSFARTRLVECQNENGDHVFTMGDN